MKETAKFQLDDDFLLESAERRFSDGDYLGALTVLNKREAMHDPLADAYALAADVYEELGVWENAADAWYRFLDTCNEADFSEGYAGLAVACMHLGNEFQSSYYYKLSCGEDGFSVSAEEFEELAAAADRPKLRLVYAKGTPLPDSETLAEGLAQLKSGELEKARATLHSVDEESADYPSACGIAAMCSLMMGEEDEAERECTALLKSYPDNIQLLTSYCAVLGARDDRAGAKEVARRLYALDAESTEDLYRIATALCETGLDAEAYDKLSVLKERLPYDANVLWFYAVAAHRTGRSEQAVEALEFLTLIYPRKAVAQWYLEHLRLMLDGGEPVKMNYYYRLPETEYREIAAFFLALNAKDGQTAEIVAASEEFKEKFRLAFDEMEGRDEKLQLLAAKVAVKCHADALLRAVLLDFNGNEGIKISVLHDLIARNEDNSFGIVVCNLYREFFIHELELGRRKSGALLQAFADVYSKYALFSEEHEGKLCAAAEEVYDALAEGGAWELFEDRSALAAAIYREARLSGGVRPIGDICKLFDADPSSAKRILNYLM